MGRQGYVMKAIVIDTFGGAEQLKEQEVPKPTCGINQVIIQIHATSVNPVDFKVRQGHMEEAADSFPLILGGDAAGIVAVQGGWPCICPSAKLRNLCRICGGRCRYHIPYSGQSEF